MRQHLLGFEEFLPLQRTAKSQDHACAAPFAMMYSHKEKERLSPRAELHLDDFCTEDKNSPESTWGTESLVSHRHTPAPFAQSHHAMSSWQAMHRPRFWKRQGKRTPQREGNFIIEISSATCGCTIMKLESTCRVGPSIQSDTHASKEAMLHYCSVFETLRQKKQWLQARHTVGPWSNCRMYFLDVCWPAPSNSPKVRRIRLAFRV